MTRTMEEELKIQQRQTSLAQSASSMPYRHFNMSISSESAKGSTNTPNNITNEWKEVD